MVGSRLESSSISSRGGLFGRRKKSSAAATCALPPLPSSSCPDAVVAEQLHQFDLRLKQLEEIQIVKQPRRPLLPPASSPAPPPPPPPPPPAAVLAPAAPVAAPKAQVKMRPNCFSAELRRAAEAAAAKFAHRQQQRQPEVHVPPLERQVAPPRAQIGNNIDQLQQKSSSSSSSSCSMTSIARLREANLRSSLMERLRLLEDRIFQLSFELDQERNSGASSRGSPSTTTTATTRTRQTWSSSDKEWPPQSMASSSSTGEGADRAAAEMAIVPSVSSSSQSRFTLGQRLQAHILSKLTKPAKDSKLQMVTLDGAGNAYSCKKEKKRMERTRIYKRWFPLIGC